jgi:hypothetical protein
VAYRRRYEVYWAAAITRTAAATFVEQLGDQMAARIVYRLAIRGCRRTG